MEVKAIIKEIEKLPISDRFEVVERALKSIRKEESNNRIENLKRHPKKIYEVDDQLHIVSEKSLAEDWLSEEDNRWDSIL